MNNDPELLKSMLGAKCPECHKDLVVGLGMYAPVAAFVLTPAQLQFKKDALITAINESRLGDEQKKAILDQYSDPHVMVDPSVADFMINELKTVYGEPPKSEEAKKPNGTKKPKN